ncbi:hypothetical protein EV13_1480 [Prochlorococcus sp. MIT 0702]|nr:hypothetical protein EV12_0684 [Prochlorococcus sp. MIT 0701]KGG28736.1 hypothetical protein EV13_1480 [Prochlorococcus sp. MIT 0702]KGG35914.1 hypothetical protein EV14_0708 [Prochlorococcus sp. MIT 0703]
MDRSGMGLSSNAGPQQGANRVILTQGLEETAHAALGNPTT